MDDNKTQATDIPDSIRESLTEIIDYLWADELMHARDTTPTDSDLNFRDHVFAHLVKVRTWLQPGYLPDEVRSPAATLAKYVLLEMGRFGLSEDVRAAASGLLKPPGNTPSMRIVVEYLEQAIREADYWGPPEEIWDALEKIRDWLDAAA